jgi:N-acetylglucosaminyldiphosphoundecaprenol N-acetyl-beta-D-mannosaminyltransferase
MDRAPDAGTGSQVNIPSDQRAQQGEFRQILGITFFVGSAQRAVDLVCRGGLLVVPAAPALKNLGQDAAYREALLNADVAITDSSLMVVVWNFLQRDRIRRLSGLEYLIKLLTQPDVRKPAESFWIMANPESAAKNLAWLSEQGIQVLSEDVYVAPVYGSTIHDDCLLQRVRERKPRHIVITIGGGTQEKLGLYLKRNLNWLPAIHCIGAAISFLSGDQVRIPMWADRFYLGWLFRCISEPRRYIPRYWSAHQLVSLMFRYRKLLPVVNGKQA